jgi:hypothetical protein
MADTLTEMAELVRDYVGDSGTCSIERAKKAVNEARRLLWEKAEWNSTAEYVCICCVDRCFTLPNRYSQIKLAWIGSNSASLADEWFNATDSYALQPRNSCHRLITEAGGRHVVFRDYTSAPYQIAVVAEDIDDVGVKIVFDAQDEYSTYRRLEVTSVAPPNMALSLERVVSIRGVTKPRTQGRIRVYAWNPDNGQKLLLAVYQPQDVNPTFRRFRVPKTCKQITIYAAKKYFDLENDTDLVEFTPEAMRFACLALNSLANRKQQEYLVNLQLAISEEEKAMESDEIPTAGPLRIADYRRPDNLIVDTFLSPSANDYFMYP